MEQAVVRKSRKRGRPPLDKGAKPHLLGCKIPQSVNEELRDAAFRLGFCETSHLLRSIIYTWIRGYRATRRD
jgi:hypothetical protein